MLYTSGAGEIMSETASKSSRASGRSELTESTQKHKNVHQSPRSSSTTTFSNQQAKNNRNRFGFRTSNSSSKEDKKIGAYVAKVRDELATLQAKQTQDKESHPDTARLVEILTKIRMLLDVRVEKGDKSPLADDVDLGPAMVEVIRQYSSVSTLMEECTCILYFLSVLNPTFKKSVARLFKCMGEHKSNVAIQRASCEAIRNVVQANPDALPRIAPSLGVILQSMAAHGSNSKLIFKSMELLADLALEPVSKPLFVQKGGVGLLHVLSAMTRHASDPSIAAAGCRCLANLSLGATPEVLQRLTPALDIILKAMNRHTNMPHVQLYGIWALGNLSHIHHAEIVQLGGIDAILPSLKEGLEDARLQQQGCASLCAIIAAAKDAETKMHYVEDITNQQGIPTILQSLTRHCSQDPVCEQVQLHGLGVLLACASHSMDHHEILLAEGGLDVIIRAMTTYEDSVDVAARGMELLKSFTRQSLDFQRAVFAKGGIGVVVGLMKRHVEAHKVQDPAFACLRNIAIHPENRNTVAEQNGIPVIITNMEIYIKDAAIQAYGCDTLGRLALGEDEDAARIQQTVFDYFGMDAALAAMQAHPNHPGVQDRAIFLLLSLSANEEALQSLKERKALEPIKQARIPQKEAAMERCERLIKSLESRAGWFGRK